MNDFLMAGGVIETREFQSPQDVMSVPQRVIINCPRYGGRKLWSDESIVPVRGQIAWLIPQDDANYGLFYKDVYLVARRDGIVVQPVPGGDDYGWNDANEEANRQEAEAGFVTSPTPNSPESYNAWQYPLRDSLTPPMDKRPTEPRLNEAEAAAKPR